MNWYPQAIRRVGLPSKVWPEPNVHVGIIEHSAEGYESGLWAQLDGAAQVSWHFTILKDGRVYQHYDLTASCWHAGSKTQNLRYIGIEHEGVSGEPLTEAQVASSVALTKWIAAECMFAPVREPVAVRTLWEHREVPGSATTCPNGRIPWERYMPTPDPNHEDGYDTGLTRINAEAAIESIAKIHKQAEGDAFYLIQAINRVFNVNYHL